MRLGACLVLDNNNFGSMLQSFATQQMLEKYDIDYDLIKYKKKKSPKMLLRLFNPVMWSDKLILVKRKLAIMSDPQIKVGAQNRVSAFNKFRSDYFHKSMRMCVGYDDLLKAGKEYDSYMVGSDQLWSPSGLETNFYNLNFADDDKFKFSYAASFGVSKISDKQTDATKAYLNRIDKISVRENSGAVIVEELTGKKAQVVVDPTILFSAKEWDERLEVEPIFKESYILVYFLGENPEHRKAVKELKKQTGKKIVLIPMERLAKANKGLADIESYEWGPKEFVNLIKHADCVCTDSFHGMVFSTLYHRKFIIFNRYDNESKDSKNTRIDSFCENYGLSNRRYNSVSFVEDMNKDIDYSIVDERMNKARYESYAFLNQVIKEF